MEPVLVDGYVPVIDLSAAIAHEPGAREAVARALDVACKTSGFFVVVGHGIPQEAIDTVMAHTVDFFELPIEAKQDVLAAPKDPTLRGLRLSHAQAGAGGDRSTRPPDLCELYTMNRLGEPEVAEGAGLGDAFGVWSKPNLWPTEPPGFKESWMELYGHLEQLSVELMRFFAIALGLEENYFDAMVDEHITNLCANNYYPITSPPPENSYRKGPHTDSGTMTVLYQDDSGGLQVINRQTGEWVDVPPINGSFVVNLGDLMAIWTNDRLVSTMHRLLIPPVERWSRRRISLPFFHQPNWSAVIECLPTCTDEANPPKHEPVISGEYLEYKVTPLTL